MLGCSSYIAVCTAWPVLTCMEARSAIRWSLTAAGAVWEVIVQKQYLVGVTWFRFRILFILACCGNIDQRLLLVRVCKGISPIPNSILSAEASNHVTTRCMGDWSSIIWSLNHIVTVVYTNKLLLFRIMQSIFCCKWVINVNPAVLVHDKSKRIVCKNDALDITHWRTDVL